VHLFDDEPREVRDWWVVCPGATPPILATDDESLSVFDTTRVFLSEYDRERVASLLKNGKWRQIYIVETLFLTLPQNPIFGIALLELCERIPHDLMSDILALSHNGTGRHRILFPPKRNKITPSLLKAFGLRGSEEEWVPVLAENEAFVRMVAGAIKPEDWSKIPFKREQITTASFNTPTPVGGMQPEERA